MIVRKPHQSRCLTVVIPREVFTACEKLLMRGLFNRPDTED